MNIFSQQDVTDPTDFDEPKLAKLDASYRCPICKEFLDGPVSLHCGHSFCSLCIRGALPRKQECPSCRAPAVEGHLRKALALEEGVIAWKAARPIVLSATRRVEHDSEAERPSKKRKLSSSSAAQSSSSSSTPRSSNRMSGKSSQPIEIESSPPPDSVPSAPGDLIACPACNKRVQFKLLNGHLDRNCKDPPTARLEPGGDLGSFFKAKPTAGASSSKSKAKKKDAAERQPIAKYSYDAMKTSQIKAALISHGLWDTGTREAMVSRLQQWVTLYNANLDRNESLRLSDSALRAKLRQWEEAQAHLKGKAPQELPEDPKAYADAHADDFAKLIAQARASHAKNKTLSSAPSSDAPPSEDQASESGRAESDAAIVVE